MPVSAKSILTRPDEEVMGQQGLGEMNNNRSDLFIYALQARWPLEEASSITTGYTKRLGYHQIYRLKIRQTMYVIIYKKFRRSLQDAYVKCRANIASDHHFSIAHLKLKLERDRTGETN